MNLKKLVRKNIWELKAYSSARDEFKGEASVYLDANENPHREKYNRYPDPRQEAVKAKIGKIKNITSKHIFLGNGSDEAIDLIIRVFCEPGVDNIVNPDPTYGMYEVCANINNVELRKVLLDENFTLNADKFLAATDKNSKVVFLCSPNNPSANLFNEKEIEKVLTQFNGIVVIDEAYIDFAPTESWITKLDKYPNLIVIQTLSKAWGLAAIRMGMAFASPEIIGLLSKVKYPYNINELAQEYALIQLDEEEEKDRWVADLLKERDVLMKLLPTLPFVEKMYPSDANYILVKVDDATTKYKKLADMGVIVRNRSSVALCKDCLRITVGTKKENEELIAALKKC